MILAILAGVAAVSCAFVCSRFAPRCVRQQREAAVADARTILAAIRYLATPELPARPDRGVGDEPMNRPQSGLSVGGANVASLANSNQESGPLAAPAAHG